MSTVGKTFDPGKFVTMFCDASFCPNTKACGWAVWIKHGKIPETIRVSGVSENIRDSIQAEYQALVEGVSILMNKLDLTGLVVVIQSDCVGALDMIDTKDLVKVKGAQYVKHKHVKGHRGLQDARACVNTWCDKQAKVEMRAVRDKILSGRNTSSLALS